MVFEIKLKSRLEGFSIKVGPGESAAHCRIADIASERAWLRACLDFLGTA